MSTQSFGYRVANKLNKEDFIRASWITLAKEDAPLEVFNENFEAVSIIEHEVVVGTVAAELSYQASVGYDRQESHLETESYYDSSSKTRKERLVTKYKTVTDWNVISNRHSTTSTVMVENISGVELDKGRLKESLLANEGQALNEAIANGANEKVEVSDDTLKNMHAEHEVNFHFAVAKTLPGDRHKDLVVNVDSMQGKDSEIYLASEYATNISYGGKKYNKYAFPFGYTIIGGDEIKSPESAAAFKERQLKILTDNKEARRQSHNKRLWEANKKTVFTTIALMLLSFLTGMLYFLPSIFSTLIGFAFSGSMIYTIVNYVKSHKKVQDSIDKENEEEQNRIHKEIEEYANNRKAAVREALNKKLLSLGMVAASDAEFS